MKLISYRGGFGRVEGDEVIPMGTDILDYLRSGASEDGAPLRSTSVVRLPPVPAPGKIVCIGLNYRDHVKETGQEAPVQPVLFPKFGNSVVGPGEPVVIPDATEQVDYEAELGVVIGKRASRVSPTEALGYVAGYTCINDVSARDLQFSNGGQWLRGKAVDTFLPSGPWMVTADQISDPQSLSIRCLLNGSVMQDSNTSEMVFGVAELISFISQTLTLEPGDLIASGTPAGVGFVRDPAVFLKPGDEVAIEISGIGTLTNPVA
ncbi:MAG: fumarylacetoacetate hydrolase [Actinobacteria bacterium]|nr:fumarylacetoacetate hydrolase [Actinomycetota bacterium]